MKGYTDFAMGFMGASTVATKPISVMKYMDWDKVKDIIEKNPDSVIYAGLMEDWGNTSGLIFAKGNYYDGYVYGASSWATPIVDVNGEEIECWTSEETKEGAGKPDWLYGSNVLDSYDYEEVEEFMEEDYD